MHTMFDQAQLTHLRTLLGAGFSELVRRFRESAREQIAEMQVALRQKDAETLCRASHKLRGAAASLGARAMAEICARIEARAQAGALAETAADLSALEFEYLKACALLEC